MAVIHVADGSEDIFAPHLHIVIGADALAHDAVFARLYAVTRQAPGGINAQALAAIENALLDIKGKALGVSVAALLGGPIRQRLRLYWSHCGTYRMNPTTAGFIGKAPMTSLDDVVALGRGAVFVELEDRVEVP